MSLLTEIQMKHLWSPPESVTYSESDENLAKLREVAERALRARAKEIPEPPPEIPVQDDPHETGSPTRVRHSYD